MSTAPSTLPTVFGKVKGYGLTLLVKGQTTAKPMAMKYEDEIADLYSFQAEQ